MGFPLAVLIPPAEVDIGSGSILAAAQPDRSTEVVAGFQLASLAWEPTRFDVGGGYVGSFRDATPAAAPRDTAPAAPLHLALDGGYASVGYAVDAHRHWRTWVSGRIETLHGSFDRHSFDAWGAAVRMSTELFVTGKGVSTTQGAGGAVAGTLALGLYVEAVHRDLPEELGRTSIVSGLSLRVPLTFAGCD